MPDILSEFEAEMVRGCLRELAHLRGCPMSDVSAEIASSIDTVSAEEVNKFINRQSLKRKKVQLIAPVALDMIFSNHERILQALANQSPALANYGLDILQRHHPRASELPPGETAPNTIFENWSRSYHQEDANLHLRSGIYQIFMRHKPLTPEQDDLKQTIVVELVYIDSVAKKCVLVGSDRHVNYGAIHLNAQQQAFFLYQSRVGTGFVYRFYCLRLEDKRNIYPSLSIRIGDQSSQPVASECFAIFVSPKHAELYAAFKQLGLDEKEPKVLKIPEESVMLDYIVPSTDESRASKDPQKWPAKQLKDFPFFASLITRKARGFPVFQEPIRAISNGDLAGVLDTMGNIEIPKVFQHSRSRGAFG